MNNTITKGSKVLTAKRTTLSTLVCLAIACSGSAMANQLPGTGMADILNNMHHNTLDRGAKLEATTPKELFGDLKSSKIADQQEATGQKVPVKSFSFDGSSVFSDDELLEQVRKYENADLTLGEIKNAAREITKLYRDKGYFVARAYIPAQEADNGIIRISILEGVIGDVNLNNESGIKDEVIVAYAKGVKNERIVLSNNLERKALLINDLSGVKDIEINASSGQNLGESDLHIKVLEGQKHTGRITVDNYGSKYAGRYRTSAVYNLNNVSGVGDQLTFTGLVSQNARSKSFSGNYMRPISYDGWKIGGSIYNSDYELNKIGNLISYGESTGISAWASYPLVKTQEWSSEIKFGGYTQAMQDSIGFKTSSIKDSEKARKHNSSLHIEWSNNLATSFFNSPGRLYNSVKFTTGKLKNKNSVSKVQDRHAKNAGTWNKIEMMTIHRQKLTNNLSLQSSLNVQENLGRNLDGTERITLSGTNGVRSYLNSELSADSGYVASFDLIYNLPSDDRYSHNASVFVDRAEGKKQRKRVDNGLPNYRSLNAVGVGYRIDVNDRFEVDATYARGFGSNSKPQVEREFSSSKNKFYIKATLKF